jgi:hypothetical protein
MHKPSSSDSADRGRSIIRVKVLIERSGITDDLLHDIKINVLMFHHLDSKKYKQQEMEIDKLINDV